MIYPKIEILRLFFTLETAAKRRSSKLEILASNSSIFRLSTEASVAAVISAVISAVFSAAAAPKLSGS